MEPYGSLWKTQERAIGNLGKRWSKRSGTRYKKGKRRLGKRRQSVT